MARFVFVRHGESVVTVNRVIGGMRTCTGLSELGVRQAEALRDRLARTGELGRVDVLVSSTMPRARETAELIAPALGGLPVTEIHDLREHDPGDADGMTFDEYVERFGERDWEDPYEHHFPAGESLAEFHDRVRRTVHDLVSAHPARTVVIACHAGVIDAALRALLHLPMVGGFELRTLNASLTELERAGRRWALVRYNDAAHLHGLPRETPQVRRAPKEGSDDRARS